MPTLDLGTPVSGVVGSRPGVAPSARFEIPVPKLRFSRFRVPDWYQTQAGPLCCRYDAGMIEKQLGRLPVQVEGVGSSLVLGTYASVLNNVVDQLLACADSGKISDSPVVRELLATFNRHGLAHRWSGTFKSFQERRRAYLDERKRPAAASAVPLAEYAEASRLSYYAIPSSSGPRRAADEAL